MCCSFSLTIVIYHPVQVSSYRYPLLYFVQWVPWVNTSIPRGSSLPPSPHNPWGWRRGSVSRCAPPNVPSTSGHGSFRATRSNTLPEVECACTPTWRRYLFKMAILVSMTTVEWISMRGQKVNITKISEIKWRFRMMCMNSTWNWIFLV